MEVVLVASSDASPSFCKGWFGSQSQIHRALCKIWAASDLVEESIRSAKAGSQAEAGPFWRILFRTSSSGGCSGCPRQFEDSARVHKTREEASSATVTFGSRRCNLDPELLTKTLRTARRGGAAGPSGMTAEHLRPLLEGDREMAVSPVRSHCGSG